MFLSFLCSVYIVVFFKLYNARQWNLFFLRLELSFLLHKKSKYDDHFKEAAHRSFAFEIKEISLAAKRKKKSRMDRQNIRFSYTSMNDTASAIFPIVNQISFQPDSQKMLAQSNIWAQTIRYWKSYKADGFMRFPD